MSKVDSSDSVHVSSQPLGGVLKDLAYETDLDGNPDLEVLDQSRRSLESLESLESLAAHVRQDASGEAPQPNIRKLDILDFEIDV